MRGEAEFESFLARVDRAINRSPQEGEAMFRTTRDQQRARARQQRAPDVIANARNQIARLERERQTVTAAAGRGSPGAWERLDAINRDIARYNYVISQYNLLRPTGSS